MVCPGRASAVVAPVAALCDTSMWPGVTLPLAWVAFLR